jgi:hypothetical protein
MYPKLSVHRNGATPGCRTAEANGDGCRTAEANGDGCRTAEADGDGCRTAEANGDGCRTAEANGDGCRTAEANGDGCRICGGKRGWLPYVGGGSGGRVCVTFPHDPDLVYDIGVVAGMGVPERLWALREAQEPGQTRCLIDDTRSLAPRAQRVRCKSRPNLRRVRRRKSENRDAL